jgi:hypothetical protein
MKQKLLRTLLLLVLLLTGAFATAHAQPTAGFTVNIPFAFTVNREDLPAGQYRVWFRENGQLKQLRISSVDKKKSVIVFTTLKEAPTSATNSKLIFRRYGNRSFLGEIWARGEASGHEIVRSAAEKQLRKQLRKEQLSARATAPNKAELLLLTESH